MIHTEKTVPKQMLLEICGGVFLFTSGLILDDVYIINTGLAIIIIATVVMTGQKIIHHMEHAPKGL